MEDHSSRTSRIFSDSFAIELTGKIMVIAIIVLFLVVVFVLILQLYARWFWSRIDESTPASASRPRSALNADQESALPAVRKGLDPAVLRSLPVLVFEPEDFNDGLECAVCLSELTQGEKARLLPRCHHGFHVDCIDMWFQSNSTCPLCRNPVAEEELESRGENLDSGSPSDTPIFPTNVLFWGDETQVSSRGVCLDDAAPTASSSSPNTRLDGLVTVDIPGEPSTSSSPPPGGCFSDGDTKSAVTTRLRTLKRLLSRERRVGEGPISGDLEQVGR